MTTELKVAYRSPLTAAYLDERWRAIINGESTGRCEGCTGCCRAGYVIGLSAKEAKRIPHTKVGVRAAILPLPDGTCPFLIDNACSIYAHRPQQCREFDCRDQAFSGLRITDDGSRQGVAAINESIERHVEQAGGVVDVEMTALAQKFCRDEGMGAISAGNLALVAAMSERLPRAKKMALVKHYRARACKEQTEGIKAAENLPAARIGRGEIEEGQTC